MAVEENIFSFPEKRNYKKKRNPKKINTPFSLKNAKGVAVVEMLPLLSVFIILFGLIFGFWTSIHKGILQSISARFYAFEVINNRTQFLYHRDAYGPGQDINLHGTDYYKKNGYRFFAVVKEQALARLVLKAEKGELSLFNKDPMSIPRWRDDRKANPIWFQTGYGICIDFNCGGR